MTEHQSVSESTHDEVTVLRQRVAELEQCYKEMEQCIEERAAEYKRMEKELQTSQEHFRMIADYTYDWEYFREPDGQFTYMSPACESITGYLVESFLNDAGLLAKLAHPDDRQLLANCLEAAQEGVTVPPIDIHIVRSDGEERWIQHVSQPVYNQDGEWLGTRSSNRDITEQKQAEDDLRVFKALAESAPDAIGIATFDGIMTYANPVFRTMFGYGNDTLGIINTTLFTEEDQRERIPGVFEEGLATGSWSGFLTGRRKDGSTFLVQLSMTILRDTNGNPFAVPAIIRDMTSQQCAEAERHNLQQQVIDAQQAALQELSAPLLPISDKAVIMPLIGSIDTRRAQQIMETLLEGVAQHKSEVAILDITGVQVVDTQVANALIQAAQAVKLLGAQVVLTGIGPTMAQTLVSLGTDLSSIVTRGSLQSGMAYAIQGLEDR